MKESLQEKISSTFRALRSRNYRLFFTGQCISLIGTWIQNIAMTWLIYSLTHSALAMGTIMFINSIPSVLLAPFAGVIVDRINKYKALIILQILFGLWALLLAVLTLTGTIQIWHIIVLGLCASTTMAFDMPLRQAFVINLVEDKSDLNNAISLNSSSFNLARLIGPSIAGILIGMFGEGICFLINSLSYIAVVWALLLMKIRCPKNLISETENFFDGFKDGITYAFKSPQISYILVFLAITSFIGMSYPLLMPIFAKDILGGNAQTLGYLMSAAGIGALIASLQMASKKSIKGLPKWLCIGAFMLALAMSALSLSTHLSSAMVLLFLIGFGMVSVMITSNTLLQLIVDNDKRGRVMSLYTISFTGTLPLSNLASGAIANKIGILHTFLFFGIIMLFIAYIFTMKFKHIKFQQSENIC